VTEGARIVQASWAGTAVFTVASALGVVAPQPFSGVSSVVSVALFGAGCVVFVAAFLYAVRRSRTDDITVAMLFFLMGGGTPRPVRRHLLASLAVEVVVAVAAATARPFTSQATSILAPMWGLSLCGLWAARHGRFKPR
jgi:hypothetical protein